MMRFHVAAEDHEEMRLHLIWLGSDCAWVDIPSGHIFIVAAPHAGTIAAIAAHPKADILPQPTSPVGLSSEHARKLAHVNASEGEVPHAVYTRLFAAHPHAYLHPDV
jgi:hypothetical protein